MDPSVILSASTDYADLALDELETAAPKARAAAIAPGTHAITGVSFAELAQSWRERPPIFIRHLAPVDFTQSLSGTPADLDALEHAVTAALAERMTNVPFSVQTRIIAGSDAYKAFDVNSRVSQRLAQHVAAKLDVRHPSQIVSILIQADRAHIGLSSPSDNLSKWSGGQHRLAREDAMLSRAEFKLLEALDTFELKLPPGGRVLDLGAAPGGWTRILRKLEQNVVAVDPARLHPSLESDSSIEPHRTTAESYLPTARKPFQAIFNDIRQEPRDSAALMQRYAHLIAPGGFALMTLKLRHGKRSQFLAATLRLLAQTYTKHRARQLFHNRSEVTILLQEPRLESGADEA